MMDRIYMLNEKLKVLKNNLEHDILLEKLSKEEILNLNKQKIKLKILLRGIMVLNILAIAIRIRKKLKIL